MNEQPTQPDSPESAENKGAISQPAADRAVQRATTAGATDREKKVKQAAGMLWVVAVIEIISLIYSVAVTAPKQREAMYLQMAEQVGDRNIQDDDLVVKADGTTLTFAELKKDGDALFGAMLATVVTFSVVIIATFIVLGGLARKYPFGACLAGLIVYVAIHLIAATVDHTSLLRGVLIKIIAVAALAGGIQAGLDERKARKREELEASAAVPGASPAPGYVDDAPAMPSTPDNSHQRPAEGAAGASKDPDVVIPAYQRAAHQSQRSAVFNEGIERLKRNQIDKPIGDVLLDVRDLRTHFTLGTSQIVKAVDGISFQIRKGETFCLVGESGSGKSITAMSTMQLIPKSISSHPGDGQIVFHHRQDDNTVREVNVLGLADDEMRKIRGARISMIFQEPMTSLNPVHTIGDQIAEALLLHTPLRGKEVWARVLELLEMVGIPDAANRIKDYPHRLSGGQRQRVMIAIAMACEPDLLIADEPTTALDVTIQAQILELMNDLQRKKQMSILFITHDIGVVNIMADRVAVMQKGKIVEIGELNQVVHNPQHDYTKQLIAALPEQLRVERDQERERHAAAVAAGTEQPLKSEMQPDEPLVWMEDLQVYFPIRKGVLRRVVGHVKAVDHVDLSIKKGKILALVGESGSGKTTLGRAILRLVEPTGGSVYYNGGMGIGPQFANAQPNDGEATPVELTGISLSAMRPFRRDLQFIFQDPYSSLNPRLRIVTTLTEPMAVHGIGENRDDRQEMAAQMLEKMDLNRDMLFRYPHEFSGGQRQRIGMARALLLNPRFIVCDEVTSALDVSVQAEILQLLLQLREEFNLTLLFITHNIAVVEYLADEVAVMYHGKIVERGAADDVCRNPQHDYSQKLLSAVPRVTL